MQNYNLKFKTDLKQLGTNLVEAKASSSRLEFKKFYEIALKSSNETQYWLELLVESKLVMQDRASILLKELNELTNMIAASVLTLKQRKF